MTPAAWNPLAGARLRRLDNGLTLCLLEDRRAPVVSCCLWYAAGTRDEGPVEAGVAHFLEHMMFKGSQEYGPGEVDRLTQALGGSNNAFTSHDATVYHFDLSRERWTQALSMEADRMVSLTLDENEVARERQVILEEITMYEDEPWDALEMAVHEALFEGHPYGRPVLGTRESLAGCGPETLRAFHRRFYRPDNAVLVLSGDLGCRGEAAAVESFGAIPSGAVPRPALPRLGSSRGLRRLRRRQGEVPRMMLGLVLPPAQDPLFPTLRLLTTVLAGGRTSRLHRRLVDEGQLCLWVSAGLSESPVATTGTVALEVVPGVEPAQAEAAVLEELERLRQAPPSSEELARARRILVADWTFAHERIHLRGLAAGFALTLFDLAYPHRQLEATLNPEASSPESLRAAAERLDPEQGGVLGWSIP